MVTIGLIVKENTNYEYVINMITAQIHDSIEIICSLDISVEDTPYDILDFIKMHTGDNVRRVHMIRKRCKSYEEHIKSIVHASCGEYIFIHSSKDWLYDANVIKSLSEEITEKEDIIAGSCVLLKEGQYVGQTFFSDSSENESGALSIINAVKNGLPLLISRDFLQGQTDIKNGLDLETVKLKVTTVPSLCHEIVSQEQDEAEDIEYVSKDADVMEPCWWKKIFGRSEDAKEKIRVAFIVQMLELWDKQAPLFEEMLQNPLIEPSIILVPAMDLMTWELKPYADEIEFMSLRYPDAKVIKALEADGTVLKIKGNQFDYIFYQRPYDTYLPEELRTSNVYLDTKICYVPYGYQGANVFMEGNTNDVFFKNVYMSFLESEEIKGVLEEKFAESVQNGEQKFLSLGYPVFDKYLNLKGKTFGKKKQSILWTPRWAFDPKQGGSHFVDYKESFVGLADKYPKTNIMIRPHPLMWENVVKEKLMSQDEVDKYKLLLQSRNIEIDANKMMEDSVKESGVLVTDFSTIIITYFMTGKPIIYCPMNIELNELFKKLLPGMYVANSWDEVEKYLDMIEHGQDVLYKKRQEIIKKELKHLGGGTKRIINAIIEDYNED